MHISKFLCIIYECWNNDNTEDFELALQSNAKARSYRTENKTLQNLHEALPLQHWLLDAFYGFISHCLISLFAIEYNVIGFEAIVSYIDHNVSLSLLHTCWLIALYSSQYY